MRLRAFASRPEQIRRGWPRHQCPPFGEARLGKLLQMPKRGRSAKPAAGQPGEVILFTGVRYERNDTPSLPTKPAGAASGKRRRG